MTPIEFFKEHAGWSYDPETETSKQGKARCAKILAQAEKRARETGCSFAWGIEELDSSEWGDEKPPYKQWCCIARDATGKVFNSLGGIDFGRDIEPWGQPYRRVVEAELALELPETVNV